MIWRLVTFSLVLVLNSQCKKTNKLKLNEPDRQASGFSATATAEANSASDNFFSIWRKPYEKNIKKHKTSAKAERLPYSGAWYPEVRSGTAAGGALQKYDQAFGTDANTWERSLQNHTRNPGSPIASWAGHCNGFAAAAQRHQEPTQPVEINGVNFTPQDIKALLAEIYMSAKPLALGGKRCERTQPKVDPFSRQNKELMGECEDVNPASFHLALANWLGGSNPHTIIADLTVNEQVWNYPVYEYECQNCTNGNWKEVSASEAMQVIGGSGADYVFNQNASKFVHVELLMRYADALGTEEIGKLVPKTKNYGYILELNDQDEIIGGEWAKKNHLEHPDFVWVSLEATPGSGNRRFANPKLDVDEVLDLWRESLKKAGVPKPFEDIREPVWEKSWGRYGDFEIVIDGASHGAVFLGKEVKLAIKKNGSKYQRASLRVFLNNKKIGELGGDQEKFDQSVNPLPGWNKMVLEWDNSGSKDVTETRFYAMK